MSPRSSEKVRRRGPSPDKTANTRRVIVTAALDLFLANGFAATRMIDVAQRAGVAKGTLYLYFADKDALFEGVLRDALTSPIERMVALEPEEGESIRDFLARVAAPFLRSMEASRRAALVRLVIVEGTRFPVLAETHYRLALEPILGFLRRLSERALAAGEITSDAPVLYPQLMLAPGLVSAIWNGLFGKDRPIDAEALFKAYLDLVFGSRGSVIGSSQPPGGGDA